MIDSKIIIALVTPYVDMNRVDIGSYNGLLWPLLLTWFNFNPSMDK